MCVEDPCFQIWSQIPYVVKCWRGKTLAYVCLTNFWQYVIGKSPLLYIQDISKASSNIIFANRPPFTNALQYFAMYSMHQQSLLIDQVFTHNTHVEALFKYS